MAGPYSMGPGQAQPEKTAWIRCPVGSQLEGTGRCNTGRVAGEGGGLGTPTPRLALGTWNIISLVGNEPELVRAPWGPLEDFKAHQTYITHLA